MNDKELEKILNFVLNNMGNDSMMRIVHLQKTAQIYYLKSEKLEEENKKLREALEFYAEPWELGELDDELLVRKIGSYDNFREVHSIAIEALKQIGELK